jgi:predicted metal-dependent RNase
MKVHEMKGAFSAHSDFNLSKKFVSNLSVKPKKVILNHGEPAKLVSFAETIKRIIPGVKTYTPENLESIRLN